MFPAPNSYSEALLYASKINTGAVNAYNNILGFTVGSNPLGMDRLLGYAYCQGYTGIILYEMSNYQSGNFFTTAGKNVLRDFIAKAKAMGIDIFGASNTSLSSLKAFEDYNNTCPSSIQKFKGIVTENEWWWWSFNNATQGPNGEYGFTQMKNTLTAEKTNLTAAGLMIYGYIGHARPNGYVYSGFYLDNVTPLDNSVVTGGTELSQLQGIIDVFMLHDYIVNDTGNGGSSPSDGIPNYSYAKTRCTHFTAPVTVMWIISTEEDFSGPFMEGRPDSGAAITYPTKSLLDAYQYITINRGVTAPPQQGTPLYFNAETNTTVQNNVNVTGITNFIYRTMVGVGFKRLNTNGNRIWVNAGPDISVIFTGLGIPLQGLYLDDMLPNNATYTITWSIQSGPVGASLTSTNTLNTTFNYSLPGTYLLRLTVNDGLTTSLNEMNIVVQPNGEQMFISMSGTDLNCNGDFTGTATALVTGGVGAYTYSWSGPGGGYPNAPTITGLQAGTYTVIVTDSVGNTITDTITITEPTALLATASKTDTRCKFGKDGSVSVVASGGTGPYTYSWNTVPIQTTAVVVNLTAGTYTATVTDAHGCTDTDTVTIVDPTAVTVTIAPTDATCGNSDGSAIATPAGGTGSYTYAWSNGGTTNTITGVPAGNYTCVVTDTNGCRVSVPTTIGTTTGPTISITLDGNVSCFNGTDGGATATITVPTTGPYTYLWSNGQTTASLINATAGTYSVTVTDALGCEGSDTIIITQPNPIFLTFTQTGEDCSGSNGSITVNVAGGTAPYSYLWNTTDVTATISGLGAGTYTVTVTDINSCQSTASLTISNSLPPTVVLVSETYGPCEGYSNGTITISASGGQAPYIYVWDSGNVQPTETGLSAGTANCTVTDANGCTTLFSHTLPPLVALNLSIFASNTPCDGSPGIARAIVSGGQSPYTYLWSTGATTQQITTPITTTYTVVVTDASGCTATDSVLIFNAPDPALTLTPSSTICSGSQAGSITASVTGGLGPYNFAWTGPSGFTASSQNISNLASGSYTCICTDQNGCTDTDTAVVASFTSLVILGIVSTPSCVGDTDGSIDINVVGGTAPYTYLWSNGATTQDLPNVPIGTYSVTVTDSGGCTGSHSFTIVNPTQVQATIHVLQIPLGQSTGGAIIIDAIFGGTGPYFIDWSTGDADVLQITDLDPGTYTVTITDANGCQIEYEFLLSTRYKYRIAALRAKCCMADLAYKLTKAERYGRDDLWCLKLQVKYMRLAVCLMDRYADDMSCIDEDEAAYVLEQLNKICGCCECDFDTRVFDDTL